MCNACGSGSRTAVALEVAFEAANKLHLNELCVCAREVTESVSRSFAKRSTQHLTKQDPLLVKPRLGHALDMMASRINLTSSTSGEG